jgi:FemAB-related protein (PEP-CTERM system-associated)
MNMTPASGIIGVRVADLSDPDERSRIEAYVLAHQAGTPFHLPAWSMAVARGCRQTSHYLVAGQGDGTLAGVLPLTECRSPLFGTVLASAGFGVGGGILAEGTAAVAALADACWSLAQRLGCPGIELRGGLHPGPDWTVEDQRYQGFVKPLARDDEAELAAIPRKQRAEVRKAMAGDFEIRVGSDRAAAAAHYRVYSEMVRNLGTPVFPRRLFTEVLDAFGTGADILTVWHRGAPVSSVLSLYWKGAVYPYWGGGTAAARALRANDRLYFELMHHARARGCTRFDFGRSKTGTGPAAYKRSWGFEPQPLTYYDRVADGAAIRDASPLNPKYRLQIALWKKLPLWAANLAGPTIARGLG